MNAKIAILLILGISFLFFGCAKKGSQSTSGPVEPSDSGEVSDGAVENGTNGTQDVAEADIGEEIVDIETETSSEEADDMKSLADLFQVDTDQPLGDEGLDTSTPDSE